MKKTAFLLLFVSAFGLVWGQSDCNDNAACNYDAAATGTSECTYATTWYVDIDGDGYGTSGEFDQVACEAPSGLYVSVSGDACPTDALKQSEGTCGCGTPDLDTDSDGVPNCNDGCPYDASKITPGSCGCGYADTDSDSDGTADCDDGCPDDPLKTAAGTCGCGTVDSGDSDNDGILDCIDVCNGSSSQVDSDGDGVGDECEVLGCTYAAACNFNESATENDGTCVFADASRCQQCIGSGTDGTGVVDPDGPCDCENGVDFYTDALGICGGGCDADSDGDGLCDDDDDGDGVPDDDPCVGGDIDDCGVCNGTNTFTTADGTPCTQGEAGCLNADGHCDCDGNIPNSCGDCGAPEPAEGYNCDGTCVDANSDGICDAEEVPGCKDETACNYNALANVGDDSVLCFELDACGVCGGAGIPAGACNCAGEMPAAYYDCNGVCLNDADGDGLCDEYENSGCTVVSACNYNPSATDEDNDQCVYADALGVCGGGCDADSDGDGLCDDDDDGDGVPDDDPCVGTLDACGVCNGDGIPEGDCDCFGNELDALNVCGGNCLLDEDGDGICDLDSEGNQADAVDCDGTLDAVNECDGTCTLDADGDGLCDHDTDGDGVAEDPCINSADNFVDECGVCGGNGVPDGACDCDGNSLDILGVCGGGCTADVDNDGICDDIDDCVGELDECGVCNGSGIPTGYCDCDGSQLDALNICGGTCAADVDGDGICDEDVNGVAIDPCVGVLDECGVCNGSGPLPDCGCAPVISGYCDCNNNVMDECGVCGGAGPEFGKDCDGNCLSDADGDGICDALEDLEIVRAYEGTAQAGKLEMNLEPFSAEDAMQDLIRLHELMAENLDDGALKGSSQNLIVQRSIVDNGTLEVDKLATFDENVRVNGSVQVQGDIQINGDATIEGVTFANGGLATTTIDMSGDLEVNETLHLSQRMDVTGAATMYGQVGASGDLSVVDGLDAQGDLSDTKTFTVAAKSGAMSASGALDANADVSVAGHTQLDGVNIDGNTTLDRVTMDGALDLNSSGRIDGLLRINEGKFTLNGATGNLFTSGQFTTGAKTHVKGDLHVFGFARILGTTFANGGVQTTTIDMEGDLDVGGNAIMRMTLDVDEAVTALGDSHVGGDFAIHNGSASDSTLNPEVTFKVVSTSGSVTSSGVFTSEADLSVSGTSVSEGNTTVGGNLDVDGMTTLQSSLAVSGNTTMDALTVNGASSVGGDLTLASNLDVTGTAAFDDLTVQGVTQLNQTTLNGTPSGQSAILTVESQSAYVAEFTNTSSYEDQGGIQIKMGRALAGNNSDFMVFANSAGTMMGRIEGETTSELGNNESYVADHKAMEALKENAKVSQDVAIANHVMTGLNLTAAIADIAASASSITGCAGFGFCMTTPIWSYIAAAAANLVSASVGVNDAINSRNEAEALYVRASAAYSTFQDNISGDMEPVGSTRVGITYQSGSADYAEWIPKENPDDVLYPGQVVGIKRGKVSLQTADADHLFVVSTQPIVLGNMPKGDESAYIQAAFLGQVPVFVHGPVREGDFIVSSGLNDGTGIAVSKESLKGEHLKQIVGVAWESSSQSGVHQVLAAVGFQDGIAEFTAAMETRIEQLEQESAALERMVYSWARGNKPNRLEAQKAGMVPPLIVKEQPDYEVDWSQPGAWTDVTPDDIAFFEIPQEAMQEGLDRAIELAWKDGVDVNNHPVWSRLQKDESFKTEFLDAVKAQVVAHNDKVIAQLEEYQAVEITRPKELSTYSNKSVSVKPLPVVTPREQDGANSQKRQ